MVRSFLGTGQDESGSRDEALLWPLLSVNSCCNLLVSFRHVSDGLSMLILEAIQLASYVV